MTAQVRLTRPAVAMGCLLAACAALALACHQQRHVTIVYTHAFYIPIALGSYWWGLRGGVSLGVLLASLHLLLALPDPSAAVALRAAALTFVGAVMGALSDRWRAARSALGLRSQELTRRVQQLDFLFRASEILGRDEVLRAEALRELVALVPAAMRDPEGTSARLTFEAVEHFTPDGEPTPWSIEAPIERDGRRIGSLAAYRRHAPLPAGDEPFLPEERALLRIVAGQIGRQAEREAARREAERQRQQLIQADKLASLGTLVSGVAHEVNNPNHFIMMNASAVRDSWSGAARILERHYLENGDFLLGGISYDEARSAIPEAIEGVLDGSRRIQRIVRELRDFARPEPPDQCESVDINAVVRSAVLLVSNMVKASTKRFEIAYADDLPRFQGSYQRVEQVVINLLQNACQALPAPDRGIRVETGYDDGEACVTVIVADEGTGIAREHLPCLTDPFFTTKRERGGTGLGLAISHAIVEEHGGRMEFETEPGTGTRVTVRLPAQAQAEVGESAEESDACMPLAG